jgi:archaellum component FlaC
MANIDERLDRLTERHEALTQTVELLAHEAAENNKHIRQRFEDMAREAVENDRRYYQRFEQIATTLEAMLKITQNHERRLQNLESDSAA